MGYNDRKVVRFEVEGSLPSSAKRGGREQNEMSGDEADLVRWGSKLETSFQ